jgi:hypothetical protein
VTEHLTREDRRWLRTHGWIAPPPQPEWDEAAEELVVVCPDCSNRLVLEHQEVMIWGRTEPVSRIPVDIAEVLARHNRTCKEQP